MSDVLAVVEHRRGDLRTISFELVTAGRELVTALDGQLHVAVIGGSVSRFAERLNREGVDVIHTVDNGPEFNHDVYVRTVNALCEHLEPEVLLAPHTVNAIDYVPAVAIDREMALVTDVLDLAIEEDQLVATRGYFESKATAPVVVEESPSAITIRSGEWPVAEGIAETEVREFEHPVDEGSLGATVKGYEEAGDSDVNITSTDFLIGVGRGIGEKENLDVVEELADVTGATIAASRPLIDKGWFDTGRQVGQSGKTVSPDVYLAVGISGAIHHVSGIKGSGRIIAINTDPNAPIFDVADQAIVGDYAEVVPALTDQLR